MFSRRLPPETTPNALSRALDALRASGTPFIDLTESNPTRAGFPYPDALLRPLGAPGGLRYAPEPLGIPSAREAVAAYYGSRGTTVAPSQIVLTASSSEAYGWLFKLLCDPGDRVLVPRPSYPLFEHLTRLEAVEVDTYALDYHGRWEIDVDAVAHALTPRTKAVLVVSPNNPTGSYVSHREWRALTRLCAERGVALVADEVFADYPLDVGPEPATELALQDDALAFTLGGLSKCAGLPQLKLGWIVVGGPAARQADALAALELVADSYLSVSTPVQLAAADLLAGGVAVRAAISRRTRANLDVLTAAVAARPALDVLRVEGGWYAVLRVPATRSEESLVLGLLDETRVLVHPGYFFDFPHEAYLIVSLLPEPDVFVDAVGRILSYLGR